MDLYHTFFTAMLYDAKNANYLIQIKRYTERRWNHLAAKILLLLTVRGEKCSQQLYAMSTVSKPMVVMVSEEMPRNARKAHLTYSNSCGIQCAAEGLRPLWTCSSTHATRIDRRVFSPVESGSLSSTINEQQSLNSHCVHTCSKNKTKHSCKLTIDRYIIIVFWNQFKVAGSFLTWNIMYIQLPSLRSAEV